MAHIRTGTLVTLTFACCLPTSRLVAATPIETAFGLYCKADDRSIWFCEDRQTPVADSQMWDILAGYCMDYVPYTASRNLSEIRKLSSAKPPTFQGQAAVCEAFAAVPPPLTLRFSHRTSTWEDTEEIFKLHDRRFERDPVTGVPTVHLRKGDRLGLVVTETNPLLHAANRGEAKEDNIEQMKNLEKLVGLLGGGLGALTADVGVARALKARRSPTAEESDRDRLKRWAQELEAPLKELGAKLKALVDERSRIQLAAQMLENGPATFRGALDPGLERPGIWRDQFEKLNSALSGAVALDACEAVFAAFPLLTTTDNVMSVDAAAVALRQLLDVETPPCGDELSYPATVEEVAIEIQRLARAAVAGGAAELQALRARQALARAENLQTVLVLHRMMRHLNTTRQSAKDTLSKEEDTRKGAVALNIVADRVRDAAVRRDTKKNVDPLDDELILVNRIYLPEEIFSSAWTKVRTTPLKIAVNSPYADQVPSSRPKDVSTTYRMVRRNFDRFSVSAGLIYTKAHNTIYAAIDPDSTTNTSSSRTDTIPAVTNPDSTTTARSTTTTTPELKEIVEKERQSRAGSYGLFANYRFVQVGWFGIGVQGGVATSTDNPAFFAGVSANAGQYLTFGLGCGAFRVKKLGIGASGAPQQVGDKVAGSDDIRTANRWSRDCRRDAYYLTMSLNITGLPLFSPK